MAKGVKEDGPHPVDRHVGRRVSEKRIGLGYNQSDLGRALGLTFQQIQKYERGVNRVSAARLLQIASVLKSTGAALLGELETAEGDELALAAPGVAELLAAFRGIKDAAQRDALLTVAKGLRG